MVNSDLISLEKLYDKLYSNYGSQGWWPLLELKPNINPTNRGSYTGYHPGDYKYPKSEEQIFEIIIGTILAQSTSWVNAERALWNLAQNNLISEKKLNNIGLEALSQLIRSSGYFNQKAKKIQNMLQFLLENPISHLKNSKIGILRKKLINIKGIGPETADSIALYAFNKPIFVVDTYTKRLLSRIGIIPQKSNYEDIQNLFHTQLNSDSVVYNEFHALIVQHCVYICSSKPKCSICFLNRYCLKKILIKSKKKSEKKKK
ncbi:endonuclease III domain-containing protein [Promethearchaeum syntrophicum]|uniref:Endonuclease III domain-containing protein n=1 Tax=Promethearchaeum syntrophicum TaxID=2594042 RepID=A0A5B9D833_9ARCH|nr:endonuclease III domain-containing protein [Candidatus Prometheoarchaeum syntrophicum]QEE15408.1 endonuclease III [Candidatus Prometheoarchaeum syntrophicum]